MEAEYRSASLVDAEVTDMNFRGYAAVFDAPWNPVLTERVGYSESVARGAFRKALSQGQNVPLLWQHDRNNVLATTRSGNLHLKEDGKGLLVEAKLPDTQLGRDVREMIQRGDVTGMSYGIQSLPSDSRMSRMNGVMHRSIANVRRLLDVTLTWEPSYDETTVELRNVSGLVAVPLQALTSGTEEQTGEDAAAGESSAATIAAYRLRTTEATILKGGWPDA